MVAVLVGFVVLFLLLFLEVPIAYGLILVGVGGFAFLVGLEPALNIAGTIAADTVLNYNLSVLPLFVLMGNLVAHSRISQELYDASNAFVGHFRGGLAMATIAACGGFSAVCGSSLATAATMAKVAMPPMRKYGYDDGLAAASVAAGGTLGMLIPPSVLLVVYGLMTETDVGKLFIAGIVPGLLGILGYMLAVAMATRINPRLGPPGERVAWRARLRALRGVWGMLLLFLIVIGGIYFGLFTPTEAAGIGAFGAFVIALLRRTLDLRSLKSLFIETGRTSAMMFLILIGAILFSNFLNVARMPDILADLIRDLDVPPLGVIFVIVAIYVALGCILESFSMVLLTVPIFYPIVKALGFDLIWFGIIVVVVTEISLITPPIGLNVFVVKAMMPEVPVSRIFGALWPFIAVDVVRVTVLIFFPPLVLFLPGMMR
jgi:tripartite ATP-independent transporter DctM subunit